MKLPFSKLIFDFTKKNGATCVKQQEKERQEIFFKNRRNNVPETKRENQMRYI